LEGGVVLLEVLQDLGDGAAGGRHFLLAVRELAQRGGNSNGSHLHSFWINASKSPSRAPMTGGGSRSSGSVVFKPWPVSDTTIAPSRPMRPSARRRFVAASVTPPAVSVKMPSVSARRRIAATISGSSGAAAWPPESAIARVA